jgi:hypothetical protein
MAYLQGAIADRTVYLTLADVPATGLLYTDVTVQIKPQGQPSLTTKTLQSSDWIELGQGKYSLVFSALDMSAVGDFTFTITGSLFDNFVYDEFTIEPAPAGGSGLTLPQQCVVSGNIANLSALPPSYGEPIKVVAYPSQFPAKYSGTILVGRAVWTYIDAYGNFSLPLVQNSVVIFTIKGAGIRAQITIPQSDTANILDLLPAFNIDYSL